MSGVAVTRPGLNAALCFTAAAIAVVAIVTGALEMRALGRETFSTAIRIGAGLFFLIMGVLMGINFLRGVAVFRRIRAGVGEIGRWTVTAEELDAFRENNKARNAHGPAYANDWRPPRKSPPEGLEVRFVADGVLVGGSYFGLVTTGIYRFAGVQTLPEQPLAIEFGTATTMVSNVSAVNIRTLRGVLRLPVARAGQDAARAVLAHYSAVDARELIVNPGFYAGRLKFGLIAAPVCFVIALIGFALREVNQQLHNIPLGMAVVGAVTGVGMLVLAAAAWLLGRAQRGR